MVQIQVRLTPDQAQRIADLLSLAVLDAAADEGREMAEQAARLNHLAARARARAAARAPKD